MVEGTAAVERRKSRPSTTLLGMPSKAAQAASRASEPIEPSPIGSRLEPERASGLTPPHHIAPRFALPLCIASIRSTPNSTR